MIKLIKWRRLSPMNSSRWTAVGAVLGGLSVALGAFAAHGLKARFAELSAGDFQPREIFELAVRYHAVHALAILFASMMTQPERRRRTAASACWAFLIGVVFFSGSLYLLATTGVRWLGAVTPIGGVAFLVGWTLLAVAALRNGADQRAS
jgi:uncharacterized membrane protein YgdD (TMEM256/DUF423 family)